LRHRRPIKFSFGWATLPKVSTIFLPPVQTVGVDPEICNCGARMVVDDAITEAEKIAEVLARLGIVSTGPPTKRQSKGELDYVFDV
jgi:hypothetical protein